MEGSCCNIVIDIEHTVNQTLNVALGLDPCKSMQADACNIQHVTIVHSLNRNNLFIIAGMLCTV